MLIVGTLVLATIGSIFVISMVLSQRRFIELQRQKLEALQKSERHFRSLIENSFDAIALADPTGKIVYASKSTERVLGYSPEEFIRQRADELFHPEDYDRIKDAIDGLLRHTPERILADFRLRHKDGSWRWIEGVAINLLAEPDVEAIIVNYRDITERKQADYRIQQSRNQLRNLSAHLQSVREEERTQIAREIHDELGQMLTVLKIDLSLLQRKFKEDGSADISEYAVKELRSMSGLVNNTIQSVRRIATELRPEILDQLGLKDAIEWEMRVFGDRTGITSKFFSSKDDIPLDQERATAVFRILQESLTNVARHAAATEVKTSLSFNGTDIFLCVEDNGRGIAEEELNNSKSLGLVGMKERAFLIGGEVDISGENGRGTIVRVRIPVADRAKNDRH